MMVRLVLDTRIISLTPEVEQDLSADAVVTELRAGLLAAFDARAQAVRQAGGVELAEQHDNAPACHADHSHRPMQFACLAVVSVAENVVEEVERVHSHQQRPVRSDLPFTSATCSW